MAVIEVIARSAAHHAHVLLAEAPGQWSLRCAVEQAVLTRGWRVAMSPADADVLAVCGLPGPGLGEAIEQLWQQMPGPRVRIAVHARGQLQNAFDEALAALLDTDRHRHDARTRPAPDRSQPADDRTHEGMDHGGTHEGMDHGDMAMMSPGGLPLAQGGPDRDGLEMDVLNLRLGPVLPYWPAGLVLRCAMHGDVLAEVDAEILDAHSQPREADQAPAGVRTLDNLVSLLALAGWEGAAAEARWVRDAMLQGGDHATTTARLQRLRRRVEHSRALRWSLRGIRPVGAEHVMDLDLLLRVGGDTYDRLLGMLERVNNGGVSLPVAAAFPVDLLPGLVSGLDLAAARLVVASLDLHDLRAEHAHNRGASHA